MKPNHQLDDQTPADNVVQFPTSSVNLDIEVTPFGLARTFGFTVALLLIAHILVQTVRFTTGDERVFGLVYMFSVGADGNIPTFYSALALMFSSMMLAYTGSLIHKARQPMSLYWFGLCMIFAFLAADEMLELHEKLIEPVRNALNTSGVFYYAWVIPYAAGVLAIGLVYLRFLLALPRRTALGFILAGGIFVTGAIGIEMLGGVIFEMVGGKDPIYVAAQTVEEALEMFGIVIFIYVIADYIAGHFGSVSISFKSG